VARVLQRIFFAWAVCWATVVTVVCGTGTVITYLLFPRASAFNFWSKVWGIGMATGVGIRIRASFEVPLETVAPVVFAINHQVALDIPAVGSAIPVPFGWVAKAELARVPFLSHAIRCSPSVFIDRSHPKRSIETMKEAGQRIRNGLSVAIFPEGSRSYGSDLGAFKRGAFLLAIEAQVPVVPVTIVNAHYLFNEKTKMARPGVLEVCFGTPIDLTGYTRKDIPLLVEHVREAMQKHLPTGDNRVP